MTVRHEYWCCPHCELLCPLRQRTCGACGHKQTDDTALLSFAELVDFQADAAFFKALRKGKR